MTDRPWVRNPSRLGSCDLCPETWVIQTGHGNRCRTHHRADQALTAAEGFAAEGIDVRAVAS